MAVPGALHTSPAHADAALRVKEAREDEASFRTLTTATFG